MWVANDVLFKKGLNIGDGAVIAANSVITKDVPPYAVVGGVPAKVIKYRFSQEVIEQLLELEWWNYDFRDFIGNNDLKMDSEISTFILKLHYMLKHDELTPYSPKSLYL